ncbi:membrane protein [Gordonia Phage StorminNorm]|nr:membrane protein [Gordonia Phage StorminNorm]
MNWRAATCTAAVIIAGIAFVLLCGAVLLTRDDPNTGGRGVVVFGSLFTISVAYAVGVWTAV